MRTIAIVNEKGGSGKTTTTVNLAATLAEQGRKVLVVDLDPQRSASLWYGVTDGGERLLEAFEGGVDLPGLVWETDTPGVDIIPAARNLAHAESILAKEIGRETVLRRAFKALPQEWDYVLIDCPPALGILTYNALAAAREVFAPVEAHGMALRGVQQLRGTLSLVNDGLNADTRLAGVIACRVNRTRLASDVVDALRAEYGEIVFRTVIRENVRLAEASAYAQPITTYDSTSNGAADYRTLAAEVIAQEEQHA